MRKAYLYNQPASDADHMNAEAPPYIDTPKTGRMALGDLLDRGGLRDGDTLTITSLGKLGKGQGGVRMQKRLAAMAVDIDVMPSPQKPVLDKGGARRQISDDDKTYLKGVWFSTLDESDALEQASRRMGWPVVRNWMNYHVCLRDGSSPVKVQRKSEAAQ